MASDLSPAHSAEGGMSLGFKLGVKQTQVFRLGQVVSVLQMSAGKLDDHLKEVAEANPMVIPRRRPGAGASATDALEMTAVEEAGSLYSHVFRALAGLIAQGGMMERVITALIEELEPSGWLGRPVDDIADTLGLTPQLIETALKVVQKRVEPTGIFARNLEECLRLQLEDRDAMTPAMNTVLARLSSLENGGPCALVAATGLPENEVSDCLAVIRCLDPKPGGAFATDPTLMREPDVRVVPSGDGWDIEFISSLKDDIDIANMPRSQQSDMTREALAKARALKQALDIRQSALRQVVGQIVERQGGFLRTGASALTPMTMSEIAQATGFHLSTVSRVLNGLLIEGPIGIVAARSLFVGAASAQTAHSRTQVRARIQALLADEDPKRPISDRRLTTLLRSEGITVSRRIVSKYRHNAGILAAALRRRQG
ncbi:RNA polymerase factor sigma-54 [Primorskyibacter marinus]|uniref:RNA polymerase factor sigma-54 n=1 Tax=Primorskyibacter marinus TaxID=1977320 RepID=UPI001E4F4E98|nr:RNA polymerase subunit sigma-54 [Primorskyibacter marinus]